MLCKKISFNVDEKIAVSMAIFAIFFISSSSLAQITASCPPHQVMIGLDNGLPICANHTVTANCANGKVMVGIDDGIPICIDGNVSASCPSQQVMIGLDNGLPVCASQSHTSSCASGELMIGLSDGAPVCSQFNATASTWRIRGSTQENLPSKQWVNRPLCQSNERVVFAGCHVRDAGATATVVPVGNDTVRIANTASGTRSADCVAVCWPF